MEPRFGFTLTFLNDSPHLHPEGYWYACTNDGNWDASDPTLQNAMGKLLNVLHEAWYDERNKVIDLKNKARRETGV